MSNAHLIAQVLGPLYLVAGIGFFANPGMAEKMIGIIDGNAAHGFLWGLPTLAAGLIMLTLHDTWSTDWTVLITLIGWLAALKGVFLMLSPGMVTSLSKAFFSPSSRVKVWAVGPLALGAFLCAKGFALA